MSTKVTSGVDITLDSTDVTVADAKDLVSTGTHNVCATPAEEVVAQKREYSIVGDAYYASVNPGDVPEWLSDLIDSQVEHAVNTGLTDYDLLVQDVRNAIDSIDVAKNTYVEEIYFQSRVDGIIGAHLETLNATYEDKYATVIDLDTVAATSDYALAQSVKDLKSSFDDHVDARLTQVQRVLTDADSAMADDITALDTRIEDQEEGLVGVSDNVTGIQSFVGIDKDSLNPNGLGMLARVSTLEKQTDGVVDFTSSTYDVMSGIEDPNNNTDNDLLIVDALPYVLWTNMSGTGVPSATTRDYTDYTLATPSTVSTDILENTLFTRDDFTDEDVDKYYKFNLGTWTPITSSDFIAANGSTKAAHVGDVYVKYTEEAGGAKTYNRSFKFIRIDPDGTAPYATDADGYTWAVVTDTDAQAMYMTALEARDAADGKLSHFYAWGGVNAPADYTIVTQPQVTDADTGEVIQEEEVNTVKGKDFIFWYKTTGVLHRNTGTANLPVWAPIPTSPGAGVYVSVGDLLTVFDPEDGDLSTYWFNGTTWQLNGTKGVLATSKWFVDLRNDVHSADGYLSSAMSNLETTSKAYTDSIHTELENKFSYDSLLNLGGQYYRSGFGMNSTGSTNYNGDGTEGDPFDSEFWINAERLVLKSPSYPNMSANFKVTSAGIQLGVEYTEATRNVPRGVYDNSVTYHSGDIVTYDRGSYVATMTTTAIPPTEPSRWQLLTAPGATGAYSDYLFTRSATTPPLPTPSSESGWETSVADVPAGSGSLWSVRKTIPIGGGTPYYSDKRVIDNPIVRELTIYSRPTTGTYSAPSGSAYNFTNNTLDVGSTDWARDIPSIQADGQKVYAATALVSGNATQTSVPISWGPAVVYAHRVDGKSGASVNYLFTRSASVPTPPPSNSAWKDSASQVPSGAGDLWVITETTPVGGGTPTYTDKRIIDHPLVREVTIYSKPTTNTSFSTPTSTYNLATGTLTIGHDSWFNVPQGDLEDGERTFVATALVTGNPTQTSIPVSWSRAAVYTTRNDGVSFTGTTEYYQRTSSGTAPSRYSSGTTVASGWSGTPQSPTSEAPYLWNFNRNSRSDGSFNDSETVRIAMFSEDGKGITSITEEYQRGDSPVAAPTGSWAASFSSADPLTDEYPYMWNRTTTLFTDNSSKVTTTVIAAKGDKGTDGNNVRVEYSADGVSGWTPTLDPTVHKYMRSAVDTNGDGVYIGGPAAKFIPEKGVEYDSNYIHIKYSDDGISFTANNGEVLGDWIGTLIDQSEDDSTTFGDYSWKKVRGEDGTPGKHSVYGSWDHPYGTSLVRAPNKGSWDVAQGLDLPSYYNFIEAGQVVAHGRIIWELYDADTGTINVHNTITRATGGACTLDITNDTTSRVTATITHVASGATLSVDYTALQGGDEGSTAKGLSLSSSAQAFVTSKSGAISPSSITFTARQQNSSSTVQWSTTAGTLTGSGSTRSLTAASFGNNTTARVTVTADGLEDSITIVKLEDGEDGDHAVVGYLTNESHVVPANSAGTVTSFAGASGTFKVFEGTTDVSSQYSFTKHAGSGLIWNNNSYVYMNSSTGAYVTAIGALPSNVDTGTVTFKATRAGYPTIYKVFTISKAKQGGEGQTITGPRGRAVLSHTRSATEATVEAHQSITIGGYWDVEAPIELRTELAGDTIIVTNPHTTKGWTHIFQYDGSTWSPRNTFLVTGNQVVEGTMHGDALSSATTITAGSGSTSAGMNGNDAYGAQHRYYRFWAGSSTAATAPFRVYRDGSITATKGTFSGDLDAAGGTFNGGLTIGAARLVTPSNKTGPFIISSIAQKTGGSGNSSVTMTFPDLYGPGHNTGGTYHSKRCAHFKTDILLDVYAVTRPSKHGTLRVDVTLDYDNGGDVTKTFTLTPSTSMDFGTVPFLMRVTTKSGGWGRCRVSVKGYSTTSGDYPLVMAGKMTIHNFDESGYSGHSTSAPDTGASDYTEPPIHDGGFLI